MMSRRCYGLRPSGPPAEPGAKDFIARKTSCPSTWKEFEVLTSGGKEPLEGGGCFSLICAAVSTLGETPPSCEHRRLFAPLMSPSPNLMEALLTTSLSKLPPFTRPFLPPPSIPTFTDEPNTPPSLKNVNLAKMEEVKFLRTPPPLRLSQAI